MPMLERADPARTDPDQVSRLDVNGVTDVPDASRLPCDPIIMGTRGLGEGGSFFLGSVAVEVVHLADVPVTLVR